jgi:hypothetical protein
MTLVAWKAPLLLTREVKVSGIFFKLEALSVSDPVDMSVLRITLGSTMKTYKLEGKLAPH